MLPAGFRRQYRMEVPVMKRFLWMTALALACLMVFPVLADEGKVTVATFEEFQGAMFNDACREIELTESISVPETMPVFKTVVVPEGVTLTMDGTSGPGQYCGLIIVEGSTLIVRGKLAIQHLESNGIPQSTAEFNLQGGTLDARDGDISGAQIQITYREGTTEYNGSLLLPDDASKKAGTSYQFGVFSEDQLAAANETDYCNQIMIEGSFALTRDLKLNKFTTILNDSVLTVPAGITLSLGPDASIVKIAGKVEGEGTYPR